MDRILVRYVFPAALVLAVVFGGGSMVGQINDGMLSALGAVLLVFASVSYAIGARTLSNEARMPILLLLLLASLVLLQLVPFGAEAPWLADDSRAPIRAAYELAGIGRPPGTLSLDPGATMRFGLRWLLPTAVLLMTMSATTSERRALLLAGFLALASSGALAAVQLLFGGLYPYGPTGPYDAGLFANPNHQGLAMALMIPLVPLVFPGRPALQVTAILFAMAMAIASGSRAAWGLCALGLIGVFLPLIPRPRAALFLIVTLIAVAVGALAVGARPTELRLATLPSIVALAQIALPWGTGFGTFATAYPAFEPVSLLSTSHLNHAHNEPLQWVVEGGVAGALLMVAGTTLLVWRAARRIAVRPSIAERHQLPALVTPDGTTFVEIHRRLSHRAGSDSGLIAETRIVETLGLPVRFLGPEAQLVHFVGHSARDHLFDNGPQVLVDIAMIRRVHDIDDVLLDRLATVADLKSETELLSNMSRDAFEGDVLQHNSSREAAALAWGLMTTPPHKVSAARDRLSMRSDIGKWRRGVLPTRAALAMSQGTANGPAEVTLQYVRHYRRLLASRLPRLMGTGGNHDVEQKLRTFSAMMRG